MISALPRWSVFLIGAVLVLITAWASLCIGATFFSPAEVLNALLRSLNSDVSSTDRIYAVVSLIRFPRIVAAICVGAALGATGCMLQALLRNPLASPFVIGTSAAASFGAVLGIFLGLPYAATLVSSFVIALSGGLIVLTLARQRGRLTSESVVLTGFGIGLIFSSGTGLLQYMVTEESHLRDMVLWLLGGLWRTTGSHLVIHVPLVCLILLYCFSFSRELDLLALGESDAHRLGISVTRTRTMILVLSCMLTSLAVSLGGVIPFVGLIVPHFARRFFGVTHRVLLPASAIGGAVFLVVADTVARTAFLPHELPLGIVTSLIGAPTFLVVLRAVRRREAFL